MAPLKRAAAIDPAAWNSIVLSGLEIISADEGKFRVHSLVFGTLPGLNACAQIAVGEVKREIERQVFTREVDHSRATKH